MPVYNVALKVAIIHSGKRQIDISAKAGIANGKFSQILLGRVMPSRAEKAAIARALRKPIDEIFPELPDEATA